MITAFLAVLTVAAQALPPVTAGERITRLSAPDVFVLAGEARTAGRFDDAAALYEALLNDADADVRAEARFRLAMMRADQGRYADAATGLRRLLDDKPNAIRARLELARVLAALGEDAGARRALRQARAAGLPDDVAMTVNRFDLALRSRRQIGGSLDIAIAPDSNINRATRARTLDTAVVPLTLSDDARARSGIGLRLGGQGFSRFDLNDQLSLVPRIAAQASLYRDQRFNDGTGSALVGLEWRSGRDRLTPAVGVGRRWYGGRPYADSTTAALDWVHPVGTRAQLLLHGGAARTRYRLNDLQDGALFDLSAGWDAAATPTSGWGLSLSGYRQTARDPGYAVASGGIAALAWRDLGRWTIAATSGASRLRGDQQLFLFADRRREWLLRAGAAVTARSLAIAGFAPVFRLNLERNRSSVGIYSYRRIAVDIGIARAF
jgi:hypothetical protein